MQAQWLYSAYPRMGKPRIGNKCELTISANKVGKSTFVLRNDSRGVPAKVRAFGTQSMAVAA